jgi:type IV fimbrial biogenesis protein FimT
LPKPSADILEVKRHPLVSLSCLPARPERRLPSRAVVAGLTLVELLVGVALLAVVLSVAAPQFSQWGRGTRVNVHASDLQSSLSYARSESSRRGVRVTLCRSADPTAADPVCAGSGSWSTGWLVFVDNVHIPGNTPGVLDGADRVLRIGEPGRDSVISTTGNLGAWLAYSPQGLVRTVSGPANGAFALCQAPHGKRLTLNAVGHTTLTTEVCS